MATDDTVYPTDFHFATEIIEVVRPTGELCVGVAAFPDGHPLSPYLATDRRILADKLRMADFEVCTPLIQKPLDGGAPGVHRYTMNFSRGPREIWANLGLARDPRVAGPRFGE